MHDHSLDASHGHLHLPPRARLPQRHSASLARAGLGIRIAIALLLVALIWAAILPLVA